MRNHQLESRVRENRTHGSEGGEGESPSLPLSASLNPAGSWAVYCAQSPEVRLLRRRTRGQRSTPARDLLPP
jgi:hypothetical protein